MSAKIEFKNIGITSRGLVTKEQTKPVGIKTPIRRGSRFGLFDMNTDILKDNFRNLLLTNHNERLMNVNFGANLGSILFELQSRVNENNAQRIAENIKNAVTDFMPYIELSNMEIFINETDSTVPANFVKLKIAFTVSGLFKDKKESDINILMRI